MQMQILHCTHVALLVSDLARADHFYGTVLGFSQVERNLKFPGIWYQLGGFQIHLMLDTPAETALHNAEKWGRNRHVAFAVADLEAAKARLLEYQCPIQTSASGRAALFTQDPDGNVIELSQA